MPVGARRQVWWLAAAAAVVAAGTIAAAIALRGGVASGGPPAPAGPSAIAPDAVDTGSRALAVTPEATRVTRLVAAAKAEVASGRLAQARALLAQALAADPGPRALLELATVELGLGDCRSARRAALRVAAAAPGEPLAAQARELLGRIGRCD